MRVPLSWLSRYVELEPSAQAVAHLLTMAGLEVELVERVGADCTGVVVGRVDEKGPHPNADKLSLCKVSTGGAMHSVVCGAPNVRAGGLYPFAPLGAVVAGGTKIRRAKLRGVESEGMLCSARELGLSEEADGLMDLPEGTVPGTPIEVIVGQPDWVLEVSITPNRPDCLGLIGIAREVAALTGRSLKLPEAGPLAEAAPAAESLAVELRAPDGCPRYSARVVTGVKVGPSPDWMQRHLRAAGLRPISNVVDITNYVMLETGHPMHAFDARFVHGGRLVIRWAAPGEKLTTLDGTALELTEQDLLIADAERGIALAGIMGGQNSEIRDDTSVVFLEAAYFDPVTIRRSSKRHKLHTDSSHRFERGCDPGAPPAVLERAAFLLQRLAGGSVAAGCLDSYPAPIAPRAIRLRPGRVNSLLGIALEAGEMARLLGLLQLPAAVAADGSIDVLVPTFRPDLEGEADLAEEIARMIGFDAIQEAPAMVPAQPVHESPLAALTRELKQVLADAGLCEAISLSFAPSATPAAVVVANPLAEENGALRRNLADGLLDALQFNLQRQNKPPRFFELGRVFSPDKATGQESPFSFAGLPIQPYHAAFLLAGAAGSDWRHGNRPVDFHSARGLVESLAVRLGLPLAVRPALPEGAELPAFAHPLRRAGIYAGESCIGYVAELAPDVPFLKKFPVAVAFGEFDLEQVAALPRPRVAARAIPSIPKAQRDLAFLLPSTTRYETVETAIRSAGIATLESVALFDLFTGKSLPPDRKSMAFSLSFRHPERTLTDEEVEAAVKTIVERVRSVGGELR